MPMASDVCRPWNDAEIVAVAQRAFRTFQSRTSHLRRRTFLSENRSVRGRDFIQRVTELGRERNVPVRIDAKRGKGSHVTLYYGDRKTMVKDRRKEIGPGLQSAMIRQLGLDTSDFR